MTVEERLTQLEAKVRLFRRLLMSGGVVLVMMCLVAANNSLVDLTARSLTLRSEEGKPTTELRESGEVLVGGQLTVGGELRLKSGTIVTEQEGLIFRLGRDAQRPGNTFQIVCQNSGYRGLELYNDEGNPLLTAGWEPNGKYSFFRLHPRDKTKPVTIEATVKDGAGFGGWPAGALSLHSHRNGLIMLHNSTPGWGNELPELLFRVPGEDGVSRVNRGK